MKYLILGTSSFTINCALTIRDSGHEISSMISLTKKQLPDNSADIEKIADQLNVPYHEIENINDTKSVRLLETYQADYCLSSWPNLLKKPVLNLPKFFCIGTHPTHLPFNRGRHPLHWLINLGILNNYLTFFKMDEDIDSGNILLQIPCNITSKDSIKDSLLKLDQAGYKGTTKLNEILVSNPNFIGNKQNHNLANNWRKRTPHDITIDPRMSANMIIRTVNSYSPPYPCAKLIVGNTILSISKASISTQTYRYSPSEQGRIEPGKIISMDTHNIELKVEDEIITLKSVETIPINLKDIKYIHPPSKYIAKFPNLLEVD